MYKNIPSRLMSLKLVSPTKRYPMLSFAQKRFRENSFSARKPSVFPSANARIYFRCTKNGRLSG